MHRHVSRLTERTAHACLCVSSIFSMIGFAAGIPGIIGALCGILACIGSSILMCCAPSSVEEGNGKFTAVRMHESADST